MLAGACGKLETHRPTPLPQSVPSLNVSLSLLPSCQNDAVRPQLAALMTAVFFSERYRCRIDMWNLGKFGFLWLAELAATSGSESTYSRPTADHQARKNRRRVVVLAKEGAYSKAVRALLSDGIVPYIQATLSTLIDKHPQEWDHISSPRFSKHWVDSNVWERAAAKPPKREFERSR